MRKVSYLSYNMTTADANNPDGIVPVGRQFDFILATQAYSATKMYM